jgi:hypothetical protein
MVEVSDHSWPQYTEKDRRASTLWPKYAHTGLHSGENRSRQGSFREPTFLALTEQSADTRVFERSR